MPPDSEIYKHAYPEGLRSVERTLLGARQSREAADDGGMRASSFGVSGGGIRSATFALGVFQALARLRLLRHVDFLSTVSGGGYFGSFLGRLFTRPTVSGVDDVEAILAPDAHLQPRVTDTAEEAASKQRLRSDSASILGWLRDNGRYLAPLGSGDLLLGGAVILRNWVAIQIVLCTFALLVFVLAQLLRGIVEIESGDAWAHVDALLSGRLPVFGVAVWGSPYLLVVLAMTLCWVVPTGWGFWLVSGVPRRGQVSSLPPVIGAAGTVLVAGALLLWVPASGAWQAVFGAIGFSALLAIGFWRLASRAIDTGENASPEQQQLDVDEEASNRLSRWLATSLKFTGMVLAFALIDTLGQTIYAVLRSPSGVLGWASGATGLSALVFTGARRMTVLAKPGSGDRLRLPASILAYVGAIAAMLLLFVTIDLLSQGIAWELKRPGSLPALFNEAQLGPALAHSTHLQVSPDGVGHYDVQTLPDDTTDEDVAAFSRHQLADLATPALSSVILLMFSLFFARTWEFLNQSSLQATYGARLARSYLGASNPRRLGPGGQVVTETIAGDDIPQQQYWGPQFPGAPLHLVNVTVNETIDGRYGVQQQDRRGIGMAVGPGGLSAGVRHHLVRGEQPRVYPESGWRMFGDDGVPACEELSLGQWVGISGAAISTGLGARTNIGLSLLAGLANLRLGYWWNSGVDRVTGSFAHRTLRTLFPVQSYFLDEFTAAFRGSAQRHWYLTDGGHFENMAGYELIRRRVPVIVILDGEADPDYEFAGLANLIRKARTDFDADIRFLNDHHLRETLAPSVARFFGSLPKLRRGTWSEEPVLDPNHVPGQSKRLNVDPADYGRHSLAHAALAKVFYDGSAWAQSWLLYVKTAMTGDEPPDLLQYHAEHPSFPHESTAEQFFGEAQWESYRKLGEHAGSLLFGYELQETDLDRVCPSSLLRAGIGPQGRHRGRDD